MLTRIAAVAVSLLSAAMASAYLYWHFPAGVWFACVSIGMTLLLALCFARVVRLIKSVGLRGSGQDPVWFGFVMLPILVAACIARLAASLVASMWAVVSLNADLWQQHSADSLTGLFVTVLVVFVLIVHHRMRVSAHRTPSGEEGGNDGFELLDLADATK